MLTVKAKGNPVPMAHVSRVIDDSGQDVNVIRDEWVEVPDTRYYRQRIAHDELEQKKEEAPAPQSGQPVQPAEQPAKPAKETE